MMLSIAVLYHGVPRIMQPDPLTPSAFSDEWHPLNAHSGLAATRHRLYLMENLAASSFSFLVSRSIALLIFQRWFQSPLPLGASARSVPVQFASPVLAVGIGGVQILPSGFRLPCQLLHRKCP